MFTVTTKVDMIKKLAKYGNSHALVLDKALLELLNISDTTKLKLSTDGTSLVITPILTQTEQSAPLSITAEEASMHYCSMAQSSPKAQEEAELMKSLDPKDRVQLLAELQNLFIECNYHERMKVLLENPEYMDAVSQLGQNAVTTNMPAQQYSEEYSRIIDQFDPGLGKTIQEINKASSKLAKEYAAKSQPKKLKQS